VLYAKNGADEQMSFFSNTMKYVNGFELLTFLNDYTKISKRCSSAEMVLVAATDFEWIAKDGSKFTKYGAVKGIRDLLAIWQTKSKTYNGYVEAAKKESKDATALEKALKEINETVNTLQKSYDSVK
jgi:hypothetical protein